MTTAQATASDDPSVHPSVLPGSAATRFLDLPPKAFHSLLLKHAAHKDRSHTTHHTTHLPAVKKLPANSLTTVLIGDSRLERFAWFCPLSNINKLNNSFNAGVGGDKIQNILYRVSEGLLEAMENKMPRLWVLSAGTNNLRPKGQGGLRVEEIEALEVLIIALLRAAPESTLLVTEVSKRTDIDDLIVGRVNAQLKDVMGEVNGACGKERIVWHALPELRSEEHLLDHVHFNEEGYSVWDAKLSEDVHQLLAES